MFEGLSIRERFFLEFLSVAFTLSTNLPRNFCRRKKNKLKTFLSLHSLHKPAKNHAKNAFFSLNSGFYCLVIIIYFTAPFPATHCGLLKSSLIICSLCAQRPQKRKTYSKFRVEWAEKKFEKKMGKAPTWWFFFFITNQLSLQPPAITNSIVCKQKNEDLCGVGRRVEEA